MFSLTRRSFMLAAALLVPAKAALSQGVTLDAFVELSERLLGRAKLDREIAQIYLNAINADPDTAITLAILAQMNGNPTPEQAALSQTIVEWWYTGVYTVKGKPQLATHTGALMWPALGMPAPGTCAAPFGAWSKPPAL